MNTSPSVTEQEQLHTTSTVNEGLPQRRNGTLWSYELIVEANGPGASATAQIKVGNSDRCAFLYGTLAATVSGTPDADGKYRGYDSINGSAPWAFHKASVTAIAGSGTVATVNGGGI